MGDFLHILECVGVVSFDEVLEGFEVMVLRLWF
jgi:hypothetical protein